MPTINNETESEWIHYETAYREPEIVNAICDCCGNSENEEHMRRGTLWSRSGRQSDSSAICIDCTRRCNYCGITYATQHRWYSDYCPNCQEEVDSESDSDESDESDWYYPSRIKFYGIGPKFFGLELETEVVNGTSTDKAREIHNLLGEFAGLKGDGSLSYGIEICTQPASLEEHKKRWLPFFANTPDGLRSWKESSCGLHIHVSRRPLSDLAIAKTVCFVNASHNRRFIAQIAGRASQSYCKILPKKLGTAAKYNDDRYEAINLQNEATIEFRLFKGTLRQASVFKALEFTDSLTAYCGQAARSISESQSRVRFISFVHENASKWPNLCAFIDAKWLGRETDLTRAIGYSARENQEQFNQMEEQ